MHKACGNTLDKLCAGLVKVLMFCTCPTGTKNNSTFRISFVYILATSIDRQFSRYTQPLKPDRLSYVPAYPHNPQGLMKQINL